MRVLEGNQVLMRIFVGEQNKHGHKPLYTAILEMLREEKMAIFLFLLLQYQLDN